MERRATGQNSEIRCGRRQELPYRGYSFVDTVLFSHYPYIGRAFGGFLYVSGMVVMAYNVYKTITMPSTKTVEVADATTPVVETATAKQI